MRRQYKKPVPAKYQSTLPYTNAESIPGYQTFTLSEVITPEKVTTFRCKFRSFTIFKHIFRP